MVSWDMVVCTLFLDMTPCCLVQTATQQPAASIFLPKQGGKFILDKMVVIVQTLSLETM
jgi:hypothetical protein